MSEVDLIRLHFNKQSLVLVNAILGVIMFGIALDIKVEDFKEVFRLPKAPLIGILAQFILLPAFTYLLTLIINPEPSIALGMILVASCPGGNISNFITYLSKGNVSLSVTMTAISTLLAIVITPFNLYFWGTLNPHTAPIYHAVNLNPWQILFVIIMILGVPLALGMTVAKRYPKFAEKAQKPFKIAGIVVFILFIAIALKMNFDYFLKYIKFVAIVVFIHNATAIATGFWTAKLAGLSYRDAKTVGIEVGIQNSALGLVLIFTFFGGLGGMALVAAWWGIWHIIAGLSMSFYWTKIRGGLIESA